MIDQDEQELLVDKDKLARQKQEQAIAYAEHQKFLDDWRTGVLDSPAGRRIVWDIIGLLGYQKKMFSSDPLIMAGNCSTHDVCMTIIKHIEEAQPGILFRMQNEFRSAQANREK